MVINVCVQGDVDDDFITAHHHVSEALQFMQLLINTIIQAFEKIVVRRHNEEAV